MRRNRGYYRRNNGSLSFSISDNFEVVAAILGVILVTVLCIISAGVTKSTETSITATVNKQERVNSGESSYYLIFTDQGVFKNEDSILYGKYDSSDMYNFLTPGKTYKFMVVGWRIKPLSMYQNIITAEEMP